MLGHMEKSPTAVFYEKELRQQFPEDFELARQERLLRRVETDPDGGSYAHGLPRPHAVIIEDGKIEAIDDENPEVDPIELTLADLTEWSLDLETVGRRCQQANSLKGKPSHLDDRLFFLGETHRSGSKLAFVLGLLSDQRSARRLLAALPQLLPASYERIVVVCPTFALDPTEARLLEPARVSVVSLGDPDPFRLDHAFAAQARGDAFRRQGEYWEIRYRGTTQRLRDTNGLRYLHHLLQHPGKEFTALELVAAIDGRRGPSAAGHKSPPTEAQLAQEGLRVSDLGDAGEVADAQAVAEYRAALRDLQAQLDEADRNNDSERAVTLKVEIDFIAGQLSEAVGLGGRHRRAGSALERARNNVGKQIRAALDRIAGNDASLGAHLRATIKAGTTCSYRPTIDVGWEL